ncbi:glutathione metabolism protein [Xylophilus rhododendri]|uniref:Glutathione metabolism protein n=1 Tax=Xylophilus rhododendri TaxID=2697032 RepID=A0A857J188_9BURK|nr:MAPEG family protein [Xylophilus rhododendri]QHI96939.1 glutathione metabolism protein [Xylophilus rhododendri]
MHELPHFTLAYWCVLFAALLPIVCAGIAKGGKSAGFDNRDPRAWLAQQQGYRARANAAQTNCFENLPFFIGAVVIAHQLQAAQGWVDALALAYIVLRIGYVAAYLANLASLRSAVYLLAFAVNVGLLFVGYR